MNQQISQILTDGHIAELRHEPNDSLLAAAAWSSALARRTWFAGLRRLVHPVAGIAAWAR